MIQYRHKKFGTIVFKADNTNIRSEQYFVGKENPLIFIPLLMVEESDEWTKLGDPSFVTDDGVPLYEGDCWWYVTICANPKVARTNINVYAGKPESVKPVRRFFKEESARNFAKSILNAPTISLAELQIFQKELKISTPTMKLISERFAKKA